MGIRFCPKHKHFNGLTLYLLTWRIWCAPTNASEWQMGFNLAFKRLSILKVATRMWYMTLALDKGHMTLAADKGCGRQPLVADNQE